MREAYFCYEMGSINQPTRVNQLYTHPHNKPDIQVNSNK